MIKTGSYDQSFVDQREDINRLSNCFQLQTTSIDRTSLPSTNSTIINDIISEIRFINLEWTVYTCIQGVDDDSKVD